MRWYELILLHSTQCFAQNEVAHMKRKNDRTIAGSVETKLHAHDELISDPQIEQFTIFC